MVYLIVDDKHNHYYIVADSKEEAELMIRIKFPGINIQNVIKTKMPAHIFSM